MAPRRLFRLPSSDELVSTNDKRNALFARAFALEPRASKTTNMIVGFTVLISAAVIIIFSIVVGCLMAKNKIKRRKRDKQREAEQRDREHRYQAVQDQEMGALPQGVSELPHDGVWEAPAQNQVYDPVPYRRSELPADAHEVSKVSQIDGFPAQLPPNGQRVELPPTMHASTRL